MCPVLYIHDDECLFRFAVGGRSALASVLAPLLPETSFHTSCSASAGAPHIVPPAREYPRPPYYPEGFLGWSQRYRSRLQSSRGLHI